MVAVTFDRFNDADREVLRKYATGPSTTLTRSWATDGEDKLSGNALVYPDFEAIRTSGKGARELRGDYIELYGRDGADRGYPEPARSWPQIESEMEQWEREHRDECELLDTDAGRHFRGFTGTAFLASRFVFVHVGAVADVAEALAAKQGSALDQLISAIKDLGDAKLEEIAKVQEEAQQKIEDLVAEARGRDLVSLSGQLTDRVRSYFPESSIKLIDDVEQLRTPAIRVQALVSDRDGRPIDAELQGHGLQRALIIALLHELAESAATDESSSDGTSGAPALMLAIEEPELYQHPLQARALAKTLRTLSEANEPSIQVVYSTHSPYFTSPALFENLRLCRRSASGGTSTTTADRAAIEAAIADAGYNRDIAQKIEKSLADTLREAIFARAVLLTEGTTDTAALEGIADLQGGLDQDGVAIADCGNKSNIGIAIAILSQLEIPFFAVFDADAGGELDDEAKLNRRILALCGDPEEDWPVRAVRERSANFTDKLETDLDEIWPQFSEACKEVAEERGIKNNKDARIYRAAVGKAGEPPDFLAEILAGARDRTK